MADEPDGSTLRTFKASDGYVFYVRHWPAVGRPKARLVFVHGIRSHAGWYGRSCRAFAAAGFDVWFLDRRGSGLNTARRGDAPSFRRLIDDVAEFLKDLRKEQAWLPVVLGGISWGGKLAVGLQYRRPGLVDGIVLLCPGLKPLIKPPLSLRVRIAIASRLRPTRQFPIPLNEPDLFTSDPDWQRFVAEERHGLRTATARFLYGSFALDVYLKRAAKRVKVPSLLLLAGRDQVIDNAKTRRFALRFASRSNRVIDYADAHHTLEFERNECEFVGDVVGWVERIVIRGSDVPQTSA